MLATLALQVVLFGQSAGLAVALQLVLVIPGYAMVRGVPVEPYPGWPLLIPGLFPQAGIAEETL